MARRYAGYLVLWDGKATRYSSGRLWPVDASQSYDDLRSVSIGATVIPSLRVARNAIAITRRSTFVAANAMFTLVRVLA